MSEVEYATRKALLDLEYNIKVLYLGGMSRIGRTCRAVGRVEWLLVRL